ncbi:WD40 repeat domain-containing protein [Roseibium sp. MMSF_3544]|uniref:WD40 repeat domain-containing protein n=1 Tax=unclassified Roseibium TaxID=2629323 RepID=UPI00273DC81E|nr:WD40 repeat domain-containing protein [Roseibium sp. MMSF_3544]
MNEQTSKGLSAFELLAMTWSFEDEPVRSIFCRDGNFAAFLLSSGKIAIVRTSDAESPGRRTTIDEATGRAAIRPRSVDPIPATILDVSALTQLPITRFGPQGFAAACKDGTVRQATPRGLVIERVSSGSGPITAFNGDRIGARLTFARANEVFVTGTESDAQQISVTLDHPVSCLSELAENGKIAAWGNGRVSILEVSRDLKRLWSSECTGDVRSMNWNAQGTHLACGCVDKALLTIDCVEKSVHRIENFPAEVRNAEFNETAGALVASGAFRLVGWKETDLPEAGDPGTPLSSGKAGFVLLEAIASHPTKALVAAGYESGMIALTSIGEQDELLLRNESNKAIISMSWSPDGENLAVGDVAGECSIVNFPEQMFK